MLIDWNTVKIAPRERDLWMVVTGDERVDGVYTEGGGRASDGEMVGLYAAHWELTEIGTFLNLFRGRHGDGPDERASWDDLQKYLSVEPRWANV